MKRAVIVSAVRSGVGNYAGQWASLEPYYFAAQVIKEAVSRTGISPDEIEDVIMGNIYGLHGNIARVAALEAGIPESVGAVTIDRQCGSSIHAIFEAAMGIMAGNGDVYVACGLEHMTREPWQMAKTTTPYERVGPGCTPTQLSTLVTGEDRVGITAEKVAGIYGLSRRDLDEYALESHNKAESAIGRGSFSEQIVPIAVKGRKGDVTLVDKDESVRFGLTMEQLSKLRPAFKEDGVVTAGNACPWSDGASALVIMSEERAIAMGLEILGVIYAYAVAGLDPTVMGLGPIFAAPKALKRAGITVEDLDVIELNEAFAAQVIPCIRELEFPPEKVNPNGGAIALGHPLGATGGLLTTKLVYEMREKNYQYGLVTMCIGGGQGGALVIRRY